MADGQQSDSGQGSLSGAGSVRLKSRKLADAATSERALQGQSSALAQGELAKTRTKALAGSVITSARGTVTGPAVPVVSAALGGTERIVLIGSQEQSNQFRVGPADRTNLGTLQEAIAATPKWTTFWGDQFERMSPSRNGVRATEFIKMHPWGNMNQLYVQIPRLLADSNIDRPFSHSTSSQPESFMEYLSTYGAKPGVRGVNQTTAYTTYHGHSRIRVPGIHSNPGTWSMSPHIPQWIGVQMDGQFVFLMRDGSVTFPFKIPVVAGIPVHNVHDFSFNPPPNNIKIMYAVDTENGRVLKIDRTPAFTDPLNPNFEDFSLWAVTVFATGLGRPTGVRVVQDGTIYVADNVGNAIVKITPEGVKSTLISVNNPFWIDYMSDGKLVVGTQRLEVFIIDPVSPNLSVQVNTNAPVANLTNWINVSVDREGTWGPANEITVIWIAGPGNTEFWRYQGGQWLSKPIPNGFGLCSIGLTHPVSEFMGHYPWVGEHHPDEAIILVQGTAQVHPALIAAKPPNYPVEDVYDHATMGRGKNLLLWGAGEGVLHGTYPTFSCQMSAQAWSLIGCTADYLAQKTFAELATFIQNGMFGSFPRPEIKGRDLYAVMYYIYRSSQRFLNEGNTLMAALRSFCLPTFGQELPAITQHPSNSQIDIQMDVQPEGTSSLKVHFAQPHHPKIPEPGLVVQVLVNEGLSDQMDLGTVGTPWILPKPVLPPGQHSLRAKAVSGVVNPAIYQGRATVYKSVPSWRQNLAVNQWVRITGSAMANFPPSVNPGGEFSNVKNKLDAWNCLSIDTRTSTIWSVANGGRTDYYGNEVMKMDLTDNPVWVEMLPANSLAEFTIPNNSGYYSNGRRCSDHGFYSKVFIEKRNRAMCFGATGITTTDNTDVNVDGFNCNLAPGVNGWDARGTYPNVPGAGFATAWATAKDPVTENVYLFGHSSQGVLKWTEAAGSGGSWSKPVASLPMAFDQAASAFDSKRNRIFLLVGMVNGVVIPVCHTYDINTNAIVARTLTGPAAARANSQSTNDHGRGMVYVRAIDSYILRLKEVTGGGTIVVINPETFEATFLTTTGGDLLPGQPPPLGTAQNPWGKLLYVPELQGVLLVPNYNSDAWFLRLH
jgi:hypothetical protein